ncbi:MAG TPA: hypothetical protein VG755_36035 [Nannocystaceae bacterium]|nr:hypothetical protein [Nannocystaceae bacterium]
MRRRSTRWAWLVAVLGVALVQACDDERSEDHVAASCADYCEQARACDERVDEAECRDRCAAKVGRCGGSEREQALDDLDHCAMIECEAISTCPVGAGLSCTASGL